MRWIFWTIWGLICFIWMIVSILIFGVLNVISILWWLSFSNLLSWGDVHNDTEIILTEDDWYYKEIPDKNPWITYKRWIFLGG